MKTLRKAILPLLIVLCGCSGRYSVGYESRGDEHPTADHRAVSTLHIPPGHLPPPGACRIWVPGIPPGKQSPPGDCDHLAAEVPPGAWLLSRSEVEPDLVEVAIYDRQSPGVVIDVEIYVVAGGELVATESSR